MVGIKGRAEHTRFVALRLRASERYAAEALAAHEGVGLSEAVRRAIMDRASAVLLPPARQRRERGA